MEKIDICSPPTPSWKIALCYRCRKNFAFTTLVLYFFVFSFLVDQSLPRDSRTTHTSLEDILKHRIVRSPLRPPTVVSFQPSKRRNVSVIQENLNTGISRDTLRSPVVQGLSSSRHGPTDREFTSEIVLHSLGSAGARYSLPRAPVVVRNSVPDPPVHSRRYEDNLLNKNYKDDDSNTNSKTEPTQEKLLQKELDKLARSGSDMQRSSFDNNNSKRSMKFLDYSQVLKAIGMENEELQQLLKKINMTFSDFLEFVENGASKEQILKLISQHDLQSSNSSDNNNLMSGKETIKSKKNLEVKYRSLDGRENTVGLKTYSQEFVNEHQNVLTDLPFTEIVHEVPIETKKSYHSIDIQNKFHEKEKHSKKYGSKRKIQDSFEWSENSPKKVSKHMKRKYLDVPKIVDYDPLSDDYSEWDSYPPPKDSPIVTHFNPPSRQKNNQTHVSASILSFSIEEKQAKPKDKPVSNQNPFHVRNKIAFSEQSVQEDSSGLQIPRNKLKNQYGEKQTEDKYSDSKYVRQQLRLVFPMRGILIFCGILGIIAFFTILILIIYGAVKCNKKTDSSNYKVNEQQNTLSDT